MNCRTGFLTNGSGFRPHACLRAPVLHKARRSYRQLWSKFAKGSLSTKLPVTVAWVYGRFAAGSAHMDFQSERRSTEHPKSIGIANILSKAGTRDVAMPPNSGMNCDLRSSAAGFGGATALDVAAQGNNLCLPRRSLRPHGKQLGLC